jgi:hypothetical protein
METTNNKNPFLAYLSFNEFMTVYADAFQDWLSEVWDPFQEQDYDLQFYNDYLDGPEQFYKDYGKPEDQC